MITGQRPAPLGRKTCARSRAPTRIGTSRSFWTTRSWRGREPRVRVRANGLFDLDLGLAEEVTPALRFLLHELGKVLRGRGQGHGEHLLAQVLFHRRFG